MQDAARELYTWSRCQHPNVLRLLGLVEFRDQIGMVSDWVEEGNLPSYLSSHPEADRYQMVRFPCFKYFDLHVILNVHLLVEYRDMRRFGLSTYRKHCEYLCLFFYCLSFSDFFVVKIHGDLKGVGQSKGEKIGC